jgi:DNA-binding CsgD family transcriptional regulator
MDTTEALQVPSMSADNGRWHDMNGSLAPVAAYWNRSDRLSPREGEILLLAAHGMSDSEISAKLSISPRTVSAHMARIREKLCAKNRTHLVVRALRAGVLTLQAECAVARPGGDGEETFHLTSATGVPGGRSGPCQPESPRTTGGASRLAALPGPEATGAKAGHVRRGLGLRM